MKRLLLAAIAAGAIAACKQATAPATPADAQTGSAPTAAGDPTLRLDPGHVVAKWNGGELTYGDLHKRRENAFRKLHNKYASDLYQAEQREMEAIVLDTLVGEAAKKAGKSPQEYMMTVVGEPQISDADVTAFYEANLKGKADSPPFEQVKERIRGYLAGAKQREVMQKELARLKADAKLETNLPMPEAAAIKFEVDGRPSKGKPDAKVTIIEFSDFECPYCATAAPLVTSLVQKYPNDVRVVFLHYPLSFHALAMPAAAAAECAHQQGKFWEYHDKLFAAQRSLGPELFQATAKELGLDLARFESCRSDPAIRAAVQKDIDLGDAVGVEGTPSFFVNGLPSTSGVPDPEAIQKAIANAR